jgi:hypothetical protein
MNDRRSSPERRIYPRYRVRVAVHWQDRRLEDMQGEICDVSARGLFVVAATALPDVVGVGDTTKITVTTSAGEGTLEGMVRWRGFHPVHQSIGCGIQLDDKSAAEMIRLFPVLKQEA